MSDQGFSKKDKLALAAFSFVFWLLIPMPFWLLTSGFAGELIIPDFGLLGHGDLGIFVFSALFYAPLMLASYAIRDALRSGHRPSKGTGTGSDQRR